MAVLYFDSQDFIDTLVNEGIDDKMAKAIAKANKRMLSDAVSQGLATKEESQKIKDDAKNAYHALKDDLHDVKASIKLMQWMLTVLVGGMIALLVKGFF
jgi:Na+-translocating ferredoxin:NAD+ oxidoreductase RnfG subunit